MSRANNPYSNFAKMVKLQSKLGDIPGMRVPKVFFQESDTSVIGGPFCFTEHCEGKVAPDSPPMAASGWFAEATQQQREKIYHSGLRFFANLHQLDIKQHQLEFLYLDNAGDTIAEQWINFAIETYDAATDGTRSPFVTECIDYLQHNVPRSQSATLFWGDGRPGNMLWKDFEMVAAIDWECCGIASPLMDLAVWLTFDRAFTEHMGLSRLPGMLEKNAFLDVYQRYNPIDVSDFDYYCVLFGLMMVACLAHFVNLWEEQDPDFSKTGITQEKNFMVSTARDWLDRVK